MANLTKRDMVIRISEETGFTQQEVLSVIQKTLDIITESLADQQDVELRNFGVFELRLTKPRVGRNPKKPEVNFAIPARAIVKFKAGKVMREKVSLLAGALREANSQKSTKRTAARKKSKP